MIPSHHPITNAPARNNEIRHVETRKPKRLPAEEKLRPTQCIHHREWTNEENRFVGLSGRLLRRHLISPTLGDPIGPEEGFAESSVAIDKWGMGFLRLSGHVGNGAW